MRGRIIGCGEEKTRVLQYDTRTTCLVWLAVPKNAIVNELVSPVRRLIADERSWIGVFCLAAAVSTAICVSRVCNNFLIFRAAFDHLVAGVDLYARHPG